MRRNRPQPTPRPQPGAAIGPARPATEAPTPEAVAVPAAEEAIPAGSAVEAPTAAGEEASEPNPPPPGADDAALEQLDSSIEQGATATAPTVAGNRARGGWIASVQRQSSTGQIPVIDVEDLPEEGLTLSEGSTNTEKVRKLQRQLNLRGAYPPLVVDGEFGEHTREAVAHFQRSHPSGPGAVEGVANATLWQLLFEGFPAASPDLAKLQYEPGEVEASHASPGLIEQTSEGFLLFNFPVGKTRLKWEHRDFVAGLVRRLQLTDPESESQIGEVIGFTDGVDREAANQPLRSARAEAVQSSFLWEHVAEEQSGVPRGAAPGTFSASNATPGERARNRAVLVKLVKMPHELPKVIRRDTPVGPGLHGEKDTSLEGVDDDEADKKLIEDILTGVHVIGDATEVASWVAKAHVWRALAEFAEPVGWGIVLVEMFVAGYNAFNTQNLDDRYFGTSYGTVYAANKMGGPTTPPGVDIPMNLDPQRSWFHEAVQKARKKMAEDVVFGNKVKAAVAKHGSEAIVNQIWHILVEHQMPEREYQLTWPAVGVGGLSPST
jgi:peptidoglycan hydrolase-like protein with peptidoglycan-binding domain